MSKILLLNGPNVNLIGTHKTKMFGDKKLNEIEIELKEQAKKCGHELVTLQSNAEHILIDRLQKAKNEDVQFIILNPGGLAYTSVALRDALCAVEIPFIEVHLSNVYKREPFRKNSYFTDIAVGQIIGLGHKVYELALIYVMDVLEAAH